ncbi:hypothetical protein ABT317_02830, partial [Streptomyces carpinensis]
MADVLLAGVLGAAVLAIFLLYQSNKRHETIITQLRAEVTAEKIARLTQGLENTTPLAADELQPARRKKHLMLYIGGGVAAIFTSLGSRLRSAFSRSPGGAVVASAGVVAVASTAAALIMGATGSATNPGDQGPAHPATAPDNGVEDADDSTAQADDDSLGEAADDSTAGAGAELKDATAIDTGERPLRDTNPSTDDQQASPDAYPAPSVGAS